MAFISAGYTELFPLDAQYEQSQNKLRLLELNDKQRIFHVISREFTSMLGEMGFVISQLPHVINAWSDERQLQLEFPPVEEPFYGCISVLKLIDSQQIGAPWTIVLHENRRGRVQVSSSACTVIGAQDSIEQAIQKLYRQIDQFVPKDVTLMYYQTNTAHQCYTNTMGSLQEVDSIQQVLADLLNQ